MPSKFSLVVLSSVCYWADRAGRAQTATLFRQVYSSSCSNKQAGHSSACTLRVAFRLHIHLPTFRHCRFAGAAVYGLPLPSPHLFCGLIRVRGWHCTCTLCWCSGGTMLSAEMQHLAKALIVKLEGGCNGDDEGRVRMVTEVTFGDSLGEAPLSSFSGLGAKFLAEEAYVLIYKRLDRRESLAGSLISV